MGESNTTPPPAALKWIHQQGVTGGDDTLPYFDGTSADPKDHFIDLDTDSMETAPDVRVYFWLVGHEIQGQPESPTDLEARVAFDAKLVRSGREWLRAYRDFGCGWFLSPERDIIGENKPGTTRYRVPTAGICHDIRIRTEALKTECSFFNSERQNDYTGPSIQIVATNIRISMFWVESFKEGVVPGTQGWDDTILYAYCDHYHPGYVTYHNMVDRDETILNLVRLGSGWYPNDRYATDRHKAEAVLRRDWPNLKRPINRSEAIYGHDYLEPHVPSRDDIDDEGW